MQSSEAERWRFEEVLETLEKERQRFDEDLRRLTAAAAYLRALLPARRRSRLPGGRRQRAGGCDAGDTPPRSEQGLPLLLNLERGGLDAPGGGRRAIGAASYELLIAGARIYRAALRLPLPEPGPQKVPLTSHWCGFSHFPSQLRYI